MPKKQPPSPEYLQALELKGGNVVQPPWADFGMEQIFWTALQVICAREDIDCETFVGAAKQTHPGLLRAEAVRTEITAYMRGKLPLAKSSIPVCHMLH